MIRQVQRLTRRAGVAAMLAGFILLIGSSTASAHSYFMVSDPADGSILAHAPARVVLLFSSAVSPTFTTVQLVEAGGARYSPTSIRAVSSVPNAVVIGLPPLPNGSYRLTFSTRDSVDLHETAGSIAFGVGETPVLTSTPPQPAPPRPTEVLLRWLSLAGLSAILGGLTIALLVTGRLPVDAAVRARIQRSLFGLVLVGAGLVVAGETGLLADKAASLGPVLPSIGRLLAGSELGVRWMIIVIIVAGLSALVSFSWLASRRKQVRGLIDEFRKLGIWALLTNQVRMVLVALALTVAVALDGHVSGAGGTSAGSVLLLAMHIAAMGVWAGGVVALCVALLALRRATGHVDRAAAMAMAVGFGPAAAVSFATLGATGLLLSGVQVSTVTALLSTQYGAVLLAKIGLIGVVALFGLRHALWTWRGLAGTVRQTHYPARLPLTIGIEATGALAVVLLASVLGASAPALGPQFAPPDNATNVTQLTKERDGLLITVSVKPNRPGPNLLSVRLVNTRRPAPAPVQSVTILVRRPDDPQGQLLATTASGAAYDAGSLKLGAGDVDFNVRIVRPGLADSIEVMAWKVDPVVVARAPVVVSNQPLAPAVDTAAVLLLVVAAAMVGAGVVRLRRARLVTRPAPAVIGRAGPMPRHHSASLSPPPSRRRAGVGFRLRRRGWLGRRTRRR
jgi:copper transport protein